MRYLMGLGILALAAAPAMAADGAANPFAGTLYQSAAAIIVFLLLLLVLKKLAWGPILKGLQERENRIKADLEQAQRSAQQAMAQLAEYEAQLARAKSEAVAIIDKGRQDAQGIAQRIQDETQEGITAARKRAEAEIQYAKEQALADVYTQVARLSTQVAGRIVKREINAEDQRDLVREAVDKLQATQA